MSGHLDGPPPGPPDPPYIEGDLGAPSAEEFVHKRRSARAMSTTPDERLREALRDANEYLAQIADYSPSEVADAIDSVRAQIKDALAATDSRGKPDGASVPDQSCATCGGSGDRNGNRRAADPFGTCPGCGGTGNVAAADREAPDKPQEHTQECADAMFMHHAATGGDMECTCRAAADRDKPDGDA